MSKIEFLFNKEIEIIKYKTSFQLWFITLLSILPLFTISIFAAIRDRGNVIYLMEGVRYDIFVFLIISIFLSVIHANSAGYRIAWDKDRIYMRDNGLNNLLFNRNNFHCLAYNEIIFMEENLKLPYEFLKLHSNDEEKSIILHRPSLNKKGFFLLFMYLYEVRPDLFPDYLLDQMRKENLIK
jgi:hypothetical protein